MKRFVCGLSIGAVSLVLVPTRARGAPSFPPQTFALSTVDPKRCTRSQLEATVEQLVQRQLTRSEQDADLTGLLACTSDVVNVDVGGVQVPQRKQTIALYLKGRYGASFKQDTSGTRLALDAERVQRFLSSHDAGCSIVAAEPVSFRLEVVSAALGAPALLFSHSTPYTVRGLEPGQAFRVFFDEVRLEGCGASGELRLERPPRGDGASGTGAPTRAPPEVPPEPPPTAKPWWLLVVLAAGGVGAWLVLRRRAPRAAAIKQRLGIFISYRRDDAGGYAGRLFDDLEQVFERELLFIDESSIALGTDFAPAMERAIAETDVMLVLIGKQWLAQLTERLGTEDYVRFEVERGLAKPAYLVVPVLVGGATLPPAAELPESLEPLVGRQAFELRPSRWDDDVAELIGRLRSAIPDLTTAE